MAVLRAAFEALYRIERPGEIVDLPFRWKHETYPDDPFAGVTAETFRPPGWRKDWKQDA